MAQNEKAREIIESHYQRNDPVGWFESLYSSANGSTEIIPWADQKPNPHLIEWLEKTATHGPGRAIVVGCGLGDDADDLSRRGFDVDAFDVAPTAIAWCRRRFPQTKIRFSTADLLALPSEWRGRFDFVFEAYTIQALPKSLRAKAIEAVADLVAPGGKLLVVCRGREDDEAEGSLPWPLSYGEIDQFKSHGLSENSFENYFESRGEERIRRFRVLYQKGSPRMQPVKVGVIGCGAISGAYFENAKKFPVLEVAACSDIDSARAKSAAEKFGIARACSVEELLADRSIEIVLNLTVPKAHVPVSLRAIEAGKHVYCEKPLGIDRAEGQKLIDAAKRAKLRVGCAPDTFLGAGIQTARKVIDENEIGRPVAFTAFMMCPGHESWHPNPAFYYEKGGGPMLDLGPYYLTALLNLLGPVKRLTGTASIAIPSRTITSEPLRGTKIKVETPDHIAGTMEFEAGASAGAIGTIVMSFATRFATYDSSQPITIYGTDGTLRVPDPNGFDGKVHLRRSDDKDWREMPHEFLTGYGRSIGLADMAQALLENRPHRASGEQSMAVLDLMQGFLDSAATGRAFEPATKYERSQPMPTARVFDSVES